MNLRDFDPPPRPGIRFFIGAAWSIAFSAALVMLGVGAWRLLP